MPQVLREYYKSAYLFNSLPLAHQFTPNGKMAGAVYAVAAISDAVPLIHGPAGCGFHYRYSSRRNFLPACALACTALQEKDIVLGGAKQLRKTILETVERHSPAMIVVIPSTSVDITNDDVESVLNSLRSEINCRLVFVPSKRISHADKRVTGRQVFCQTRSENLQVHIDDAQLKGCGFAETMTAMVRQVMQHQKVFSNTVNLCGLSFDNANSALLGGFIDELRFCGIQVNAVLPFCTTEQIRTAPRASLNLVTKRIGWAYEMKKRFGTDFMLVDINEIGSQGFAGLAQFYSELSGRLHLTKDSVSILNEKRKIAESTVLGVSRTFSGSSCALCTDDYRSLPQMIRFFQDVLGLKIRHLLIKAEPSGYKSIYSQFELERYAEKFIMEAKSKLPDNIDFFINPPEQKVRAAIDTVEVIAGQDCYLRPQDFLHFLRFPLFYPLDFNTYAAFLSDYIQRALRHRKYGSLKDPLSCCASSSVNAQPVQMQGAIKLWEKLWIQRGCKA